MDTPWRGWAAVGVAALIAPIGYLGNEGMAPLVGLAGLLCLPYSLPRFIGRDWRSPAALAVMALTIWAAISFAWSPVEPLQLAHLHTYNQFQALTAPKLIIQLLLYASFMEATRDLAPRWRRRMLWGLAMSVAITITVLLIEGAEMARLYERLSEIFNRAWTPDLAKRNAARGCYGAAVLFWPAAAVLWRKGLAGVSVALFAAGVAGALMLGVAAPVAALAAGALALGLVRWAGRLGVLACMGSTLVYFAFAPLVFGAGPLGHGALGKGLGAADLLPADVGKPSWHIRQEVWRFASTQIWRRPLVGWGLDSSRAWPSGIPMHPHDAALQVWLETGLVGVVLTLTFWGWLWWRVAGLEATDRTAAAVMAGATLSYLVIGAVSFGVWQEWWLALGVFALAACSVLASARSVEPAIRPVAELLPLG